MMIKVSCPKCHRRLKCRKSFAGRCAECPYCGAEVTIPTLSESEKEGATEKQEPSDFVLIEEVNEFLDSPSELLQEETDEKPVVEGTPVLQRMFELLLDPRAIHWMLSVGGGLTVLGLIIWLVSIGIFRNPWVVASVMGILSLALLGLGWWVTLKTSCKTAGRALTFLACVIAPLNLWYYQSQRLMVVDQHLWVGGLVCLMLYLLTVRILKDPLFLYAVECGITLTVLLLAADLNYLSDISYLSVLFVILGAISIHCERLFHREGSQDRESFGLPFFWSGHVQLAVGLFILLGSQCLGWLIKPMNLAWTGNLLTEHALLSGGIWLGSAYLYFYSDLIVRQNRLYTYLAGACLMMSEVTLLLPHLSQEIAIAAVAVTILIVEVIFQFRVSSDEKFRKQAGLISMLISMIPLIHGLVLHLQTTRQFAYWNYTTNTSFIVAMIVVALTNRLAAHLVRHTNRDLSLAHFVFSSVAAMLVVAGSLRIFGLSTWVMQSPILMLLPIAYIIAAQFWRGHTAERSLAIISHFCTAVILFAIFFSPGVQDGRRLLFPEANQSITLWLGLTYLEVTIFYLLAGFLRQKSWNGYFATVAGSVFLWQFLGYVSMLSVWKPVLFAIAGVGMILVSRLLGISEEKRYTRQNVLFRAIRGRGTVLFHSGNGLLSFTFLITVFCALERLFHKAQWEGMICLSILALIGVLACLLVPLNTWKKWYAFLTVLLASFDLHLLNKLIQLKGWQKFEIFCVLTGLLILAVSHVKLFKEEPEKQEELVSLGLWMGSLFTVVPLLIAMIHFRFFTVKPSLYDELGLLTVSIMMVVLGYSWQIKGTTLIGGSSLFLSLALLIGSITYRPEVAIGVYLLIGGGVVFTCGLILSMYRDRLLKLPEQIARREGIFRVINWR